MIIRFPTPLICETYCMISRYELFSPAPWLYLLHYRQLNQLRKGYFIQVDDKAPLLGILVPGSRSLPRLNGLWLGSNFAQFKPIRCRAYLALVVSFTHLVVF